MSTDHPVDPLFCLPKFAGKLALGQVVSGQNILPIGFIFGCMFYLFKCHTSILIFILVNVNNILIFLKNIKWII